MINPAKDPGPSKDIAGKEESEDGSHNDQCVPLSESTKLTACLSVLFTFASYSFFPSELLSTSSL